MLIYHDDYDTISAHAALIDYIKYRRCNATCVMPFPSTPAFHRAPDIRLRAAACPPFSRCDRSIHRLTLVRAPDKTGAQADTRRPLGRIEANVSGDERRVDEVPAFEIGVDVAAELLPHEETHERQYTVITASDRQMPIQPKQVHCVLARNENSCLTRQQRKVAKQWTTKANTGKYINGRASHYTKALEDSR